MKKVVFFIFLYQSFFFTSVIGHVEHYKSLKYLEYDLFLNNEKIGSHVFKFIKKGENIEIESIGEFEVSKLGVKLMDYKTKSQEIYNNNQLIKFTSQTEQNDKKKYVILGLNNDKLNFDINGSSFKGKVDASTIIGSWWNHEIIQKDKQISPVSGRIIKQKVNFLGKESIIINKKKYNVLHFHFLSNNNKPLNKKKINIHVWYEEKSLLWIKSSFERLGKWEYRLKKAVF